MSLVTRQWLTTIAVAAAILLLALGVLHTANSARESMRWYAHSARVIENTGRMLIAVQEAESGSRGHILTRNAAFAQDFPEATQSARRAADQLIRLTADNAGQHELARAMREALELRLQSLERARTLARQGAFDAARDSVASGKGREAMTVLRGETSHFLRAERRLRDMRNAAVDRQLNRATMGVAIGVPLLVVMMLVCAWEMSRRVRRSVRAITNTMAALAQGDRAARVDGGTATQEFDRLARGYNRMADQLDAAIANQLAGADQLRSANAELHRNGNELRQRGEMIELLGGMAHRMQAARTDEELAAVLEIFVPKVLPDLPGALYAHNNSRNLLMPVAAWGGVVVGEEGFSPEQCWALRRGQSHFVGEPGSDIVCGHIEHERSHYHCEPLLAGGEVIGVLYLRGAIDAEQRFSLTVLSENVASALVNHSLQRGLREQTIRDPLTGLFNRRYMEETLKLEIARCARSRAPLSLIMCDVDHFKRFNDDFGHDAGDAVLRAVAAEMKALFRDGDVVCRYGGEEFTIIAPGTSAEDLRQRTEIVRQRISELKIREGGRALGATSMSFGIATWTPAMDRDGTALIKAADAVLYRAKREGRNRVMLNEIACAA